MKDAWFREHLAAPQAAVPFSFAYAGRPSTKWLAEWPETVEHKRLDAQRVQFVIVQKQPVGRRERRLECVVLEVLVPAGIPGRLSRELDQLNALWEGMIENGEY